MIDLVVTYLDDTCKKWINSYNIYKRFNKHNSNIHGARFRSWDNFKYVLRSIATNMHFINNLYIVVSDYSQVPSYINTNNVKIVTHDIIIPSEYLPAFNSNTIELFIYKIPNLSETFIYTNDDIFAINNVNENDFYIDGHPLIKIHASYKAANNLYSRTLRNTELLAIKNNHNFNIITEEHTLRSSHSMNPMLKSVWIEYWQKYGNELRGSLSRFRNDKNITQEIINYDLYMKYVVNKVYDKYISNRKTRYFNFNASQTSETLRNILTNSDVQLLCINDNTRIDEFDTYKNVTNKLLEQKFPYKCKYEK